MIVANKIVHKYLKQHVWFRDYIYHLLHLGKERLPFGKQNDKKLLKQRALVYILGGARKGSLMNAFTWSRTTTLTDHWVDFHHALMEYFEVAPYKMYNKTKDTNIPL